MKTAALLAALCAALPGCGAPSATPAAAPESSDGFPRAGRYDIAIEGPDRTGHRDEWLEVSTRPEFEKLVARDDGSRCRDRHVTIGKGAFSVKMVCDAPDGDIHDIGIERFGSYTETSIEITTETTLWNNPIRELANYRLRES